MTRNEFIENLKQEGFSEQQADRVAELQNLAVNNVCMRPLNEEVLRLRFEIEDLAAHIFGELNYEMMIEEVERYAKLAQEKGEVETWKFDSVYLNTTNKFMCARAAFILNKAYEAFTKNNVADAFSILIEASYYMGVATDRGYTLKRVSEKASANAKIRHKENAESKQEAIQYYKANHKLFN